MKAEWKKAVKRQNETEIVTKSTFAITFKDAYETTIARPLPEKAFRACGLYPLDPTNIDFSKVVSDFDDSVTDHPPPQSPLVNGPDSDTPTCLPTPVAHSTPKSPLATACQPEPPRPLPTPVAHSTPKSPLATACQPEPPRPLPTPVAHSTPKSPLATACQPEPPRPLPTPVAHSTPNPVRSTYPTAGPSHNVDASTQSTNTLQKFSMLCSQIGENTLNLYYTKLEEGYDCEDPLFSLWSAYHKELVSLLTAHTWQEAEVRADTCQKKRDALAIPEVRKGTRRTKALKLPPLISSPDFRSLLLQEADEKAEEARKKQPKLDMEEKKRAKAKEEEQKKAKREEKKREREEKKNQKEMETQLRKGKRKRKLEENRKAKEEAQKKAKTKKTSRKLYKSDSDTSVDDRIMALDDNSSDEYNEDCGSDDSTVDKLHVDNEGTNSQGQGASTSMSGPANDSLGQYLEVSTEQRPNEDMPCAPTAIVQIQRNLWLDLAVDSSLSSITPTVPMELEDK